MKKKQRKSYSFYLEANSEKVGRIPAVAQRDKSGPNLILTWPMLALGLDCTYAKHIDGYIHLHRIAGNKRFGRQLPA